MSSVAGFFALFSVGMRYASQVIFVFVAKQTANDDCAKVQLVTKENIFSVCSECRPSASGDLLSGHLLCLKVKHVVSSFNVTRFGEIFVDHK